MRQTQPWLRAALLILCTSSNCVGFQGFTHSAGKLASGSTWPAPGSPLSGVQDESSDSAFESSVYAVEVSDASEVCFRKPPLSRCIGLLLSSSLPLRPLAQFAITARGSLKPNKAPANPALGKPPNPALSIKLRGGERFCLPIGLSYQKCLASTLSTHVMCWFIVPTASATMSSSSGSSSSTFLLASFNVLATAAAAATAATVAELAATVVATEEVTASDTVPAISSPSRGRRAKP
mmetsp:Transcript_61445/g.146517  ORF Transcript_61445/g.146517 Transcript_61445/m.146517 type:complete len:236 (-) Transcript_61445:927-1634(-)